MVTNLKVGILGGGQLGAMLMRHAIDFGLKVSIMDGSPSAPCAMYSSSFTSGDPSSYDDVMKFGEGLDVLTIEMEAVSTRALRELEKKGVKVYPKPETIETIQDKSVQKKFLQSLNVPVAAGIDIENKPALLQHKDKLPFCLKKCRSGYDGYGVMVVHNESDLENAFDEPSVLEELIDIQHEISVIVSRNEEGAIGCYDPVLMVFDKKRNLLDFQLCPAHISAEQALQARELSIRIAESIKLVGIMAVEMFITKEGALVVNELAPRPHNSGHHTIEACATSQFEQLLRAILGLPPGSTAIRQSSVMVNILQPEAAHAYKLEGALKKMMGMDDVHLHWYGKEGGRAGRKMGHITITGNHMEHAASKAVMIRHLLKSINETN